MSLDNEKLTAAIDGLKQTQEATLNIVKELIELVQETRDLTEETRKDLTERIQRVTAFLKTIIEPNQKTIWKAIIGEKPDAEETSDKVPTT